MRIAFLHNEFHTEDVRAVLSHFVKQHLEHAAANALPLRVGVDHNRQRCEDVCKAAHAVRIRVKFANYLSFVFRDNNDPIAKARGHEFGHIFVGDFIRVASDTAGKCRDGDVQRAYGWSVGCSCLADLDRMRQGYLGNRVGEVRLDSEWADETRIGAKLKQRTANSVEAEKAGFSGSSGYFASLRVAVCRVAIELAFF